MAIDLAPEPYELVALTADVERCFRRSQRAAQRLAAAEREVEDATAAGRAACAALIEWKRANPDPQMELLSMLDST